MKTKLAVLAVLLASASVSATSNNLQQQIDDLKAGLHDVHMNTLQKYSKSWGLEDRANIAALQGSKLDKSVFTADQARQDKVTAQLNSKVDTYATQGAAAYTELKNSIVVNASAQDKRDADQDDHINAVQDAAQSANEKADGLAVRADGIEHNLGAVQDATQTANDRASALEVRADGNEQAVRDTNAQADVDRAAQVKGDKLLADSLNSESVARDAGDKAVNARVQQEETTRASQVVQLAAGIDQAQATGNYASSRADQAYYNAEVNSQAIRRTNQQVSRNTAQLANHEQRIGQLEQNTSSKFANIDKRMDETDRHIDAGLAGVAAIANIPQVTEYQTFAVGAGLGGRGSESAVAVGFSARASQNVVFKASVAGDSQQKWTVGGGISYGW